MEPTLSLDVRRVGEELVVTIENRGTYTVSGDLEFESLRPLAGGVNAHSQDGSTTAPSPASSAVVGSMKGTWFADVRQTRATDVVLSPGETLTYTEPVSRRGHDALHRFLFIDGETRSELAENAYWYEKRVALAQARPLPDLASLFWTGEEHATQQTPAAPRQNLLVHDRLRLRASRMKHTIYEDGTATEVQGPSKFGGDANLRWHNGMAEFNFTSQPSSIHFEGPVVVVTIGAPTTCCDTTLVGATHVVRFENVKGKLEIDGRRYTSRGEAVED